MYKTVKNVGNKLSNKSSIMHRCKRKNKIVFNIKNMKISIKC